MEQLNQEQQARLCELVQATRKADQLVRDAIAAEKLATNAVQAAVVKTVEARDASWKAWGELNQFVRGEEVGK